MTEDRHRQALSWIVAWVIPITITAAGLWFCFGDVIHKRLSRQPFDPAVWKAADRNFTNTVRIRMVDDLLRRHRFRGMTRGQIIGLIGEPDATEYFKDWDLVYRLGPERGFIGIDSEWLVFRLDGENHVIDFKIVSD